MTAALTASLLANATAGPALSAPEAGTAIASVDEVSPKWWEGDDFVVAGRGDTNGYHVLIGRENRKYAFTPLASIQPGGYDGDQWLGYTCVTGDRSDVVVSALPRGAVNRPALRDRGASVYAIKIADGSVRPLARGVAFKQHAVGCGTGDQVAMLRHLEVDQAKTELLRGSASTKVEPVATVNAQLTWAVPNGPDRVMALRGNDVVTVSRKEQAPKLVGKAQGQAFKLLAAANDQADLLVLKDKQVAVEHLAGGRLSEIGRGAVARRRCSRRSAEPTSPSGLRMAIPRCATSLSRWCPRTPRRRGALPTSRRHKRSVPRARSCWPRRRRKPGSRARMRPRPP